MEELLLRLERKIKELMCQHESLKNTNLALDEGKSVLAREKAILLAKQQRAIEQIETLVTRLKAIEK